LVPVHAVAASNIFGFGSGAPGTAEHDRGGPSRGENA